MYLQNVYFTTCDVNAVTVTNFSRSLNYDYNDLYLKHMLKSQANNNWVLSKVYGSSGPTISSDGGDASCSMAVPQCTWGQGPRCTASGCVSGKCIKSDSMAKYQYYNLTTQGTTFGNNLTDALLYSIRDDIKNTSVGNQLVDIYYIVGDHFSHSVDSKMLIDIASISNDLKIALNNYVAKKNDGPIVSINLSNSIINILNQSKTNSTSSDYIKCVDMIINKLRDCTNLNYSQLQTKIN